MNNDNQTIKPFTIERVCEPHLDVEQLVLSTVEVSESVYTRTLVNLKDSSLPDAIYYSGRPKVVYDTKDGKVPGGVHPDTDKDPTCPAGTIWDDVQQKCVSPGPGVPPPGPSTVPPAPRTFSWDLFLMLKYRHDWTPTKYGAGELLYSISLLPNEELTLETKTWETSKTQQDVEDTTDVRNVSDIKTSSSDTKEATTDHQTKEKEYVDAKAGYSGFGFSASVEGGWSSEVNDAQKNFHKQMQDSSQQASNEYKATHKVKLSMSREAGSESKTTRKIKNINQAHTLNANFYEVLREYDVKLVLYDVTLVLLGDEPALADLTGYLTWDDQPKPIKLGQMIRLSRSVIWVEEFTDTYGVSPIKLLRKYWSEPLYSGALIKADWFDTAQDFRITPEMREDFATTVLRHVRPTPGWIEPDEKGLLRWGYEMLPGHEAELLRYLYSFLPTSIGQQMARALKAKAEPAIASQIVTSRYASAVVPSYDPAVLAEAARYRQMLAVLQPIQVPTADVILIPGPFSKAPVSDFVRKTVPDWVDNKVITMLNDAKDKLLDNGNPKVQAKWTTTLPTQGIYADVALGVCSGAEDYYEIQRQFDLEMRRLEVERLRLENARIAAGNPTPTITVENPTDKTTINVDVAPTPPSRIEIRERGT